MNPTNYNDDDLVYINPSKREVIGKVEWQENGKPKKMEMENAKPEEEEEPAKGKKKGKPRRKAKKLYYPWGTYKTMKKLFRVEGKEKEIENYRPLDEAMNLALKETYWD